jgi:hypothetical protein
MGGNFMADEISEKSTKSQILQAYNDALSKLKEQKQEDRRVERKREDDTKIVKQASENSIDKIVNGISRTKVDIMNALDEVSERLTDEFKKFENLKKAIEIESNYLNDVYEIKVNADSLSALLLAQKDKKAAFESDMESKKETFDSDMFQKRIQWKTEQDNYESQKKERDQQLKKERQYEEEEYNYNLQLKRKKESDAYTEQKLKLERELTDKKESVEKELTEREKLVAVRENEFNALKQQAENFPKEIEKAVKETEKSVTERIEFKYRHQSELEKKEMEGERLLNKQMVQSLENKINEQSELIKQLTQKVNESGEKVQTIAIKAIESSSAGAARMFSQGFEKHSDQQGKV